MPPHLFAYLDLASGSMIVQAAIAGVVAVPILLRNHIRRLIGRGKPTDTDALEDQGTPSTPDARLETHIDGSDTTRP